jgi:multidrug resistance efflux pump
MKALLIFLIIVVLVGLYLDDKTKRADLATAEARADTAEQQLVTQEQQVQHLTAQVYQLQAMLSHPAAAPVARPAPSGPPAWFQNQVNGAKSALDPGAPPP